MTTEKRNDSHGLVSGFDFSTFFSNLRKTSMLASYTLNSVSEFSVERKSRFQLSREMWRSGTKFRGLWILKPWIFKLHPSWMYSSYCSTSIPVFLLKNCLFYPEDERTWFLWNVGKHLSPYTTSHSRRWILLNNIVSHILQRIIKTNVNLINAALPTSVVRIYKYYGIAFLRKIKCLAKIELK